MRLWVTAVVVRLVVNSEASRSSMVTSEASRSCMVTSGASSSSVVSYAPFSEWGDVVSAS